MVEALLLVGALEFAAEDLVLASGLTDELKVLFSMLLVLGFFGSLLLFAERFARQGVRTTHRTIQALPLPTPRILIHAVVLGSLFLAYAKVLDLWPPWIPTF
jgi:hypothetical protein